MTTARIRSPRDGMVLREDATRNSVKLVPRSKGSRKVKPMEIRLKYKTLRTLASQHGQMKDLIETYGAAVKKSRLMRKSVSFVVHINPSGEPNFRPLEDASPPEGESTKDRSDGNLESALTAARERGQERVADILSGPDMLSAEEFADLIGTSRVTVNAKRQDHQVLGLEGAKRGFRFPRWQIGEDGKPFPAVRELFDRLGGSSWAVYRFLVQHHPELDGLTGREALSRGRTAEVLEVAESVLRTAS
jgi:hypothetical protein